MRSFILITLFSLTHALTSLAIKIGLGEIGKINIEQIKHLPSLALILITNPFIVAGLILSVIAFFLYYLILSQAKLSISFLASRSLAYILVVFFSWFFLKEIITIKALSGIIIILVGIYLIS